MKNILYLLLALVFIACDPASDPPTANDYDPLIGEVMGDAPEWFILPSDTVNTIPVHFCVGGVRVMRADWATEDGTFFGDQGDSLIWVRDSLQRSCFGIMELRKPTGATRYYLNQLSLNPNIPDRSWMILQKEFDTGPARYMQAWRIGEWNDSLVVQSWSSGLQMVYDTLTR